MPVPGDTLRRSVTFFLEGMNYEMPGAGVTWDFSDLTVMSQQVDSFASIGSTPLAYQWFFNNPILYPDYYSTVAQRIPAFPSIPGFEVTDGMIFFKNSSSDFREVGVGITLSGLPIPVQYEMVDVIYRFPLQFGDEDSSFSSFSISVPQLGTYASQRNRHNQVDGWGTLITPYGQFEVLRMKTTLDQYDSLYVDSLGTGFPLQRNITQYKWLGAGYHEPLLQVDADGLIVTASYLDSLRTQFFGIQEEKEQDFAFRVFPNPCRSFFSVAYELCGHSEVRISVFNAFGVFITELLHSAQERGLYNRIFYPADYRLKPGMYLVRFEEGQETTIKRLIIQ
jgi:hypothetical protein